MNITIVYNEAFREYRNAQDDIDRIVAQLESFTARLKKFPWETCFTSVPGEPEPPLDQLLAGARWVSETFPGPVQIQAAVRRRHFAKAKLCEIWERMSGPDRAKMPPPPKD
jgi:hypothetical protein